LRYAEYRDTTSQIQHNEKILETGHQPHSEDNIRTKETSASQKNEVEQFTSYKRNK
jgi:hypothetical protein